MLYNKNFSSNKKKNKKVDIDALLASRQLEERNKFDDLVSEYPNLAALPTVGAYNALMNKLNYTDNPDELSQVEKEALDDAIITHGAKGAALKFLKTGAIGGLVGAGLGAGAGALGGGLFGNAVGAESGKQGLNAGLFGGLGAAGGAVGGGAIGAGIGGLYGLLTGGYTGAAKGRELAKRRRDETKRILQEAASFSEKSKEEKLKELLASRALSEEDRDSLLAKYPFLFTPNIVGKLASDSGLSDYDNLAANEAISATMIKDAGLGALGGSALGAILGGTAGAISGNGFNSGALKGAGVGGGLGGLGGGIYGAITGNKRARKRREEEKRILKEALLLNNSDFCKSKKAVQNFSTLRDIKKQLAQINAKIDATLGL